MTNKITEYLVSGEYGPVAGDYCEEIIPARTPEDAKEVFIRSMKQNMTIWGRMGAHNVHVQEYVPAKVRKEISATLTRDWDPDGHTLAKVAAQMETYNGMIVILGGISGSGRVECEYDEIASDDWLLKITYKRLETDAEYDKRRSAEDKKAATLKAATSKATNKKEAKERKEYARLKKKFGDTE
jgi:hypothetical protein